MRKLSMTIAALAAGVTAAAQQGPAADAAASAVEASAERVEVVSDRSIVLYPYKRAYDAVRKVNEFGRGDVAMRFRFLPNEEGTRVDNIKLRLEYEGGEERIAVDARGEFSIVPNDAAYANDAQFVINKRREDYGIHIYLAPTIKPGNVTAAELRRLVDSANAVRKNVLPWYARLVIPTVSGVRICAAAPEPTVTLAEPGQARVTLPYAADKDSPPGRPHCTEIARGTKATDQAVVSMPVDADVAFYATYF